MYSVLGSMLVPHASTVRDVLGIASTIGVFFDFFFFTFLLMPSVEYSIREAISRHYWSPELDCAGTSPTNNAGRASQV